MFTLSNHAVTRTSQRGISHDAIGYVLEHGEKIHRAGAVFYFLRRCDIPDDDLRDKNVARLEGTALVMTKDDNRIITVWRDKEDCYKRIQRKCKYDRYDKFGKYPTSLAV